MQAGLANLPQLLGESTALKRAVQNTKVTLRPEISTGILPFVVLDYVYGWDISNWQPYIDWKAVKENAPDLKFVFIKATEGTAFVSPTFKAQWDGAGLIGQYRGAYHYHHTEISGKNQAKYFLTHATKGELPPVLDVEDAVSLPQNSTTEQVKAAGISVYEFTDTVANAWGQKVVIYTGAWFWNRLAAYALASSKSCDYWGATYHNLDDVGPYMSIGWSAWTLWQWTSKGKVTGCSDRVDFDVFHGGIEKFNAWHGYTPLPSPHPEPDPQIFPYIAHVNNLTGMYVRSQPRADSTKVKWIPNKYGMSIFEEAKDIYKQTWGKIPFGWVNTKYIVKN